MWSLSLCLYNSTCCFPLHACLTWIDFDSHFFFHLAGQWTRFRKCVRSIRKSFTTCQREKRSINCVPVIDNRLEVVFRISIETRKRISVIVLPHGLSLGSKTTTFSQYFLFFCNILNILITHFQRNSSSLLSTFRWIERKLNFAWRKSFAKIDKNWNEVFAKKKWKRNLDLFKISTKRQFQSIRSSYVRLFCVGNINNFSMEIEKHKLESRKYFTLKESFCERIELNGRAFSFIYQ